jgi:anthranilate synthase/aminodeoxychorismate synthase-like glutamine amidotransferase
MIYFIDCYDSFSYNLIDYIKQVYLNEVIVIQPHNLSLDELLKINPSQVIISPGPGNPTDYKMLQEVVRLCENNRIKFFGVCLGHQILNHYYGGEIRKSKEPVHGMASKVFHNGQGIFSNISQHVEVGRYHSLVVQEYNAKKLVASAVLEEDKECVMGVQHKTLPMESVQFHPESILTKEGLEMIRNIVLH